MAGTTPKGFRFPEDADAPNIAVDIENLADDVDAELDDYIAKSIVTAQGDLITASGSATPTRLGIGAEGRVLYSNGTAVSWEVDPTNDVVTTAGDLIYGTGADAVARLAIGTAAQVLAVNTGATAPEWVTPAAGGMTLISTTTLSGAAIALTSIPQTFNDLRIVISGASNGTGEGDLICLRFNNNSTANIYRYIRTGVEDGTATSGANQGAQVRLSIGGIEPSTTNSIFVIDVPNYTSSTTTKVGFCLNSYTKSVSSTKNNEGVAFSFDDNTAITRVDLLTLNGYNWDNGTVTLFGVK